MADELRFLKEVIDGCYLENTTKVKYLVKINPEKEGFYLLELTDEGFIKEGMKPKYFTQSIMNGLVRNRYFCVSKIARRISYGKMESDLDFNRRLPK